MYSTKIKILLLLQGDVLAFAVTNTSLVMYKRRNDTVE